MFVFTAKLSKKRLTAAILALVILVAVIVILTGGREDPANTLNVSSDVAKTNDDRVKYLNSLGWIVEEKPIEEQTIIVPKDFSEIYKQYNELQLGQGFDLTKYAGLEAVRYTYAVKNYPSGEGDVVADIIVYRGRVIAGDIQSTELNGFMSGLAYPNSTDAS